jgi:hypothetical protein
VPSIDRISKPESERLDFTGANGPCWEQQAINRTLMALSASITDLGIMNPGGRGLQLNRPVGPRVAKNRGLKAQLCATKAVNWFALDRVADSATR